MTTVQVEEAQDARQRMAENILRSDLFERIEKHKDRIQTLEMSVFQLANYCFVFQGVIFTTVFSGSSDTKCHFRYLAFSLSLIAAVLNLVALLVIALRYKILLDGLDTRKEEWKKLADPNQPDPKRSGWRRSFRFVVLIFALLSLAAFAGLNLHGTWKLLCYETNNVRVAYPLASD